MILERAHKALDFLRPSQGAHASSAGKHVNQLTSSLEFVETVIGQIGYPGNNSSLPHEVRYADNVLVFPDDRVRRRVGRDAVAEHPSKGPGPGLGPRPQPGITGRREANLAVVLMIQATEQDSPQAYAEGRQPHFDQIEPHSRRHARACRGHPWLACDGFARTTWMPATSPAMTPRGLGLI